MGKQLISILIFWVTYIIFQYIYWFIMCAYYSRKKGKIAIVKTNSLITYSITVTTLIKEGYKINFEYKMMASTKEYRAILVKSTL